MKRILLTYVSAAALCLFAAGCAKQVAKVNPPAAPAPAPQQAAAPAPRPAPRQATSSPAVASNRSEMPDTATKLRIQDLINRIQDAYFDYDKHTLRPDAMSTLQADAKTLAQIISQYPKFNLTVEGYCDERGSAEYNLALGEARAQQAKEFLVSLGLPPAQLKTVSYGKERQVCTEQNETCWQKNRRAHIAEVI
jgi:peptidoglycan-associated lipoprotein